jgi:hypothetical protein
MTAPHRLHNGPPDPLDAALAPFGDYIAEAEGWLDGSPVETESQMKAVDALLKQVKAAEKAVKDAEESEAKPIYDAWKAAKARYTPTLDDLGRIKKGLVAAVDLFKRKLAEEKAAKERAAREEAEHKAREAAALARQADAADLEAQRAAAQAQADAEAAQIAAARASKDASSVKGLRTITKHEVTDHRVLLHWIAKNDREAVTAFVEEYARRNHSMGNPIDGVRVWQEKVAF